mgnify:FL=1
MKVKLFFLSLGAIVLTYLIFTANNHQEMKMTVIYDDTTTIQENFSVFLQKDLEKLLPTTVNYYHKENLEIENVVDKIKSNYNEIQEKLSSSNVIIVYLGDFELLYEKENIINIYSHLEDLILLLRKYNSKQIIYISPINLSSNYLLKDLASKHKITFINTPSILRKFTTQNYTLDIEDHKTLASRLFNNIVSTWKIEN